MKNRVAYKKCVLYVSCVCWWKNELPHRWSGTYLWICTPVVVVVLCILQTRLLCCIFYGPDCCAACCVAVVQVLKNKKMEMRGCLEVFYMLLFFFCSQALPWWWGRSKGPFPQNYFRNFQQILSAKYLNSLLPYCFHVGWFSNFNPRS